MAFRTAAILHGAAYNGCGGAQPVSYVCFPRRKCLETNPSTAEIAHKGVLMKASLPITKRKLIRIVVIESDPLRFVGLHSLLGSAEDFELTSIPLSEVGSQQNIDLALLGNHVGPILFEVMAGLRAVRPDLRIIVMGSGMDEENILKAI